MAKVLDLNALVTPVMELTLKNEDRTTLRVTVPNEGLIFEFKDMVKSGMGDLGGNDRESVEAVYDLMARLISCNLEHVTITGTELREKYRVDIWSLIALAKGYVEFIGEVEGAKN